MPRISGFEVVLFLSLLPFTYYLLALYSSWRFFRRARKNERIDLGFTPPVSILKPVKGLDKGAYANFVSFCTQDYPDYELLFCVDETDTEALDVIARLRREFPNRTIRVVTPNRSAVNDKVARLERLTAEAKNEYLAISDADVRVRPDYLRAVIAPLARKEVGAVTCLYVSVGDGSFAESLQSVAMISDFYAGVLVARQLDGVKFAFGQTVATTRRHISEFGGYRTLENRPADDLLVGRLIAGNGHEVELSSYTVSTVPDYESSRELFHKRMRWTVVLRHMRPWGHFGLLLTQALPWSVLAILLHPTWTVAAAYMGAYITIRLAITWMIGIWGLKQPFSFMKRALLVPVWDAASFGIWLGSFLRNSIRWRGRNYHVLRGELVPAESVSGD
jgi:ceramide glucosyltransferase